MDLLEDIGTVIGLFLAAFYGPEVMVWVATWL